MRRRKLEPCCRTSPKVAVVASMAAAEFSLAPDAGEVREALALVDEQLEELIDSGASETE